MATGPRVLHGLSGSQLNVSPPDIKTGALRQQVADHLGGLGLEGKIVLLLKDGKAAPPDDFLQPSCDVLYAFTRPAPEREPAKPPPRCPLLSLRQGLEAVSSPPDPVPTCHPDCSEGYRRWYQQNQHAKASLETAYARYGAIDQTLMEVGHQQSATTAVMQNLSRCYQSVQHAAEDIHETYEQRLGDCGELLTSFPDVMQQLRTTPLHESCGVVGFLIDVVPDQEEVHNWHLRCTENWGSMKDMMCEIDRLHTELLSGVQEELEDVIEGPDELLQQLRVTADERYKAQRARKETCEAGFQQMHNAWAKDRTCISSYWNAWNAESGDIVREFEQDDAALVDVLTTVQQKQDEYYVALADRVRRIVQIQNKINKLIKRIASRKTIIHQVDEAFEPLRACKYLPEAYQWGMMEVVRRRHFHRLLLTAVASFEETIRRMYTRELGEQQRFDAIYGRYCHPVIPGLQEPLPLVEPFGILAQSKSNFQTALPNVFFPQDVTSQYQGTWPTNLGTPPDNIQPDILEAAVAASPTSTTRGSGFGDLTVPTLVAGVGGLETMATVAAPATATTQTDTPQLATVDAVRMQELADSARVNDQQLVELRHLHAETEAARLALAKQVENLQEECQKQQEELLAKQSLDKQQEETEAEINSWQQCVTDLEERRSALEKQFTESESQRMAVTAELEAVRAEVLRYRKELHTLQQEKKEPIVESVKPDASLSEITRLKEQNAIVNEKLEEQCLVGKLRATEVSTLKKQLEAAERQHSEVVAQLREKIEALSTFKNQDNELDGCRAEVLRLQSRVLELEDVRMRFQEENAELQGRVKPLQEQVESLLNQVSAEVAHKARLQDEKDDSVAALSRLLHGVDRPCSFDVVIEEAASRVRKLVDATRTISDCARFLGLVDASALPLDVLSEQVSRRVKELAEEQSSYLAASLARAEQRPSSGIPVISLAQFGLNDIMLFTEQPGGSFKAVHSGDEHLILDPATIHAARRHPPEAPGFYLAKAVEFVDHTAVESDPYSQPPGTKYRVVTGIVLRYNKDDTSQLKM